MPVSFLIATGSWTCSMRSRCETTIHFESKNSQPVIVDVGSNIGLAILFFKRLYPASTVIGFEPDPGAFEVLKRNIADDRLRGVQVLNEAVHGERRAYTSTAIAACPARRS
jgi:predicted RNA methylase